MNSKGLKEGYIEYEEILETEIDILEFAERGEEVPHARAYHVRIDGESSRVDTHCPTGESLLSLVGKRPFAFELIEEFTHHENYVVEPDETVDLRKHGLKGFITARREVVTIFLNEDPYSIERGDRTVAEILALPKLGWTPETYILFKEVRDAPPMPLPVNLPVKICGCEVFHADPDSGGSS